MISIEFTPFKLTGDAAIKQHAATQQLADLMKRVSGSLDYRLLTKQDRKTLETEGFAPDLVNNLAFFTQRFHQVAIQHGELSSAQFQDKHVQGYTFAAFDPSIFAQTQLAQHIESLSYGKCCFCESPLSATSAGGITHYRPPAIILSQQKIVNSPYYLQAYEQSNLLYTCKSCGHEYKQDKFPVNGKRFPKVEVKDEQPLLVNPYQEEPRTYIRFNPLNGEAYAFDLVAEYFHVTRQLSIEDCQNLLWQSPQFIPLQHNQQGVTISDPQNDAAFQQWMLQQSNRMYRGLETIALVGLNRANLVKTRFAYLSTFYSQWVLGNNESKQEGAPSTSVDILPELPYQSMLIDSVNTWKLNGLQSANNKQNTQQFNWQDCYLPRVQKATEKTATPITSQNPQANTHHISSWLMSTLRYVVFESELKMSGKRRIVYLNARDKLYGGDFTEKCVFEAIDWQKDLKNIIKVRSHRNIWETNFVELANSRPLEIIDLFEHNELWAEGDYPPFFEE